MNVSIVSEGAGTPTGEKGKDKDDDKEDVDDDAIQFSTGEKVVTHPAGKYGHKIVQCF